MIRRYDFKIVEPIVRSHSGWKTGGIVTRKNKEKFLLLDSGRYDPMNEHWVFKARALTLVEPSIFNLWYILQMPGDIYEPPTSKEQTNMISRNWIVVSSLNGPSRNPTKHPTMESAIGEAKRLSLNNPSSQFFVYELCKAFQIESVKEIEVGDIPF